MAEGPSQVLIHSDNLSSDVQSPPWVQRYSGEHYRRMAAIAHEYGKPFVTHIDGRIRGLLRLTRDLGFRTVRTAVTPAPWGDLTPAECRAEAGPGYLISGGVPPGSFSPDVSMDIFDAQVDAWLALRHQSPALIIAPGDQLPPDGDLNRVTSHGGGSRQGDVLSSVVFRRANIAGLLDIYQGETQALGNNPHEAVASDPGFQSR